MAKPHIVIVATGGSGWLGGRQYCINLARALINVRGESKAFDLSVLVRGQDEVAHYEALRPQLRELADLNVRLANYTPLNRLRWIFKRLFLGWVNPRFEEPLVAMGATYAYPFTSRVIPSSEWLSDFQFHYFPDRMSAAEIADRKLEFGNAVARAQRITLSSHCAERDCHMLYPATVGRTNVLKFRTFAEPAWLTADPDAVRRKYHLPEKFALISNWLLPTKNHLLVLEALGGLTPQQRAGLHVVCTGDIYDYRNPGFYNQFLTRIHTLGLQAHVSVLGVIPKQDQIQLLRGAVGYLQPSLFEGWNTGVEEARQFGKRILVSDIPIHREQDLPGATYFDPHNADDLAAKLPEFFAAAPDAAARPQIEAAAMSAYRALQDSFAHTFLAISNVKAS